MNYLLKKSIKYFGVLILYVAKTVEQQFQVVLNQLQDSTFFQTLESGINKKKL